jgi:NitT/TauT family transport system ATP-binding protein
VVQIPGGTAWRGAISVIEVKEISKVYVVGKKGQSLVALKDVSFAIGTGTFMCILGPSGCGKTTLLHIIAGLDAPTAGEVRHNGVVVDHPSPTRTVVFQQYALFPWMSVAKNIEFGLKAKGLNAAARHERVAYYVDLVRLRGFQNAYPHQISGGMKQRVALARALAPDPDVVLMDEPFGALDSLTRELLQEEILRIWERAQKTFILITHSIDEAIFLGDRIFVMTERPGTVKAAVEVALPRPRTPEMRTDDHRFLEHKHLLFQTIRSEVQENDG